MPRAGFRNRHLIAAGTGYFALTSAMLAPSLALAPAIVLLAGCLAAVAIVWTGSGDDGGAFLDAPVNGRLFAGCLVASFAMIVLGGAGHFLHTPNDWLIRDAVLADLSRAPPPLAYSYDGVEYLLRAPLGMYLLPAMVGRAFGLYSAHMALLAQNAALFGSSLYLFGSAAPRARAEVIALVLLTGGLDIIPSVLEALVRVRMGDHFWMRSGLIAWESHDFSYWYTAPSLFWVPNHALPAWWFAGLALTATRGRLDIASLTASFAPLLAWTPLGIVAAPLILILLGCRRPIVYLRDRRVWLAAVSGCLFLPVFFYLSLDAATVPSKWLAASDGFVRSYIVNTLVQLPQALFLIWNWRLVPREDRSLLLLAIGLLLVMPIYSFGEFDDFLQRGCIIPMAIMAFEFAVVVAQIKPVPFSPQRLAALIIVGLGLFAPGFEIMRSFLRAPFAISDCTLVEAWRDIDYSPILTNYLARLDHAPEALATRPSGPAIPYVPRSCWPDHPMAIGVYGRK